jgi:hypothetical protein
LDLPRGFSYTVLEQHLDDMDDGYRVPGRADGMACFVTAEGQWALLRNHEVGAQDPLNGAYGFGSAPDEAFDSGAYGCVTRVVVDPDTVQRVSSNLVVTGTIRNCAGGVSPWGWLTCEETTDAGHGYVFVCSPDAATVQMPQQVVGYGRFNHEAATVDPDTLICYLTEDQGDSSFYRFVPADQSDPFTGQLQALRVVDVDVFETTNMNAGDTVDVDWVDIDEPNPSGDTIRDEAQGKGAAIFVRGEGIWYHDGAIYICSTSGGPVGGGQIFRLIDTPGGAMLELIAQSEDREVLDMPDNICVSPWGQVFMAEDGDGEQFVRALTDDGVVVPFARNAVSDSELAGVCFSPDGRVMFVNIQGDGLTLAITGPFPESPDPPDPTTGTDDGGASDGADESTSSSAGDSPATAASDGTGSTDTGSGTAGQGTDAEGCGCQTGRPSGAVAAAASLVVAGALRRRRFGDVDPAED